VDPVPACSRLGCGEAAVAVFAFDARESLVWLDPITTPGRGAGVLCERHADRLSPPRGWNLLDRRGAEFRLWTGRPAAVLPGTAHAPRRPARRAGTEPAHRSGTEPARRSGTEPARSRPCATPAPLLPFDAPAVPAPEPVAVAAAPDAPRTWSPHGRPGPEFEHVLDARTPLLARAFDAARATDDT
jgi:hypothetical protein